MQLVLSGNRVLAHGEDCFISMGGTVICNDTGKTYQNATVAQCDNCPSDIDEIGYEYHSGVFIPVAPYGKTNGTGNILVADEDCKAQKDSGISVDSLQPLNCELILDTGDKTVITEMPDWFTTDNYVRYRVHLYHGMSGQDGTSMFIDFDILDILQSGVPGSDIKAYKTYWTANKYDGTLHETYRTYTLSIYKSQGVYFMQVSLLEVGEDFSEEAIPFIRIWGYKS